jgi:hypothetical protein
VSICVHLWFIFCGMARAQGPGGGASSYLPSGAFGGFVPYTPGLGQGLGVMSRGAMAGPGGLFGRMAMPGAVPGLSPGRASLNPPPPIGVLGGSMGQRGMLGGPMRLTPARGTMPAMARPPVGSYPFRVPPSLIGPATAGPAMSM